jgi:transposase
MKMMHHVGIDVHSRQSSLEVLDGNGKLLERRCVKGGWDVLVSEVSKLPQPMQICYEASCGYGYLHERFAKLAERVVVAHPGQMRLIFRSKRKNDRIDASRIAKLLFLDEVPAVHVPDLDVRQWRSLIEFRRRLLDKRVMAKNQLRAIVRGNNLEPPHRLWTKKGLVWLARADLPAAQALQRDLLIDELGELAKKIHRVEKELGKIASKHPAVALLMTIPGVGIRTAETFVAYVDDPKRFGRTSRIGSYVGLVPCQDASASVNRLGHITRQGPATLRKFLCEAAWQARRRSATVRAWFERVSGGEPGRRKLAVVAVARKLSMVMLAMLKTGEAWRESPATSDAVK